VEVGLLIREESKEDLGLKSRIYVNTKYSNPRVKVNINVTPKAEKKRDMEEALKTIVEDRKMSIQAAIVRIMKANQSMRLVVLVGEVISGLNDRFTPSVHDIHQCIDMLVDKEYLERGTEDIEMIRYVA
jgi:hypothetical protein